MSDLPKSSSQLSIIAIVGVPFAFALLLGISYGIARSFRTSPPVGYLVALIVVSVLVGVVLLSMRRSVSGAKRIGAAVLYILVMPVVLAFVQAMVSCGYGDCL